MLIMWPNTFTAGLLVRQASSHSKRLVQPIHPALQFRIGEGVGDAAMLHDEKPIGQGRGEAEILLNQQNRESLPLELSDGPANLLDDNRREALGRLVQHQESRAGPQDARNGEHLLLAAGQLAPAARQSLA